MKKFFVFGVAAALSGLVIGVAAVGTGFLSSLPTVAPVMASPVATLPVEAAAPPAEIVSPVAPPQVVDPSEQIAADTQALAGKAVTTFSGFIRWEKAIAAGLPSQPGEIETVRAQAAAIDQDARAIRDRADAGGISPHVQRAADATSEATHEMLIGTDLASEAVDMVNKKQPQGVQTVVTLAQDHFTHATKLIEVASDEMHAFQAESATS